MPRILLILAFLAIPIAQGIELPNPPDGYRWKQILDEQSALLVPIGWHFKSQHGKNTDGFFVSKENIEAEGKFDTGLSLNVIKQVKQSTGLAPSKYSLAMIEQMQKSKKVLLADSRNAGAFKAFTLRFLDSQPNVPDVVVHNLFIANDETGTLWYYIFEAPQSEWESAWQTGDTLLSHLLLETEI
ncbi:hypothetical protein IEN85_20520 [Pelagicoccus sp. NFK12]|uniref:Uncharacterized protein n=1 Tax=Pelagicoccus enzymogenes TaxID=2773457 RepID=A0A927FBE9_9BACT|nr:hypothetical protein [Pelagicoccus enzymogenes]MBD5781897.1 hypothetical protein [Pelagicoccus enzymogenes]